MNNCGLSPFIMSPFIHPFIPLSLYIHIPWCVRKCPYCDFNSHQRDGDLPEVEYVQALLADLRADLHPDLNYIQGRTLQSIFIGGGTPSLFSPVAFASLLAEIEHLIPFAADIEITLEANPGTAELQKFTGFRAAGINRLSIGVQSFNAAHLKQLGRIHDGDEALRAADFARNAGFDNFNIDLMFGLPGQDTAQALADLTTAITCAPTHLSWYQLTIEPNTEFFRRPPTLPQDDAIAEMQEAGIALMGEHGYARYEISAYCKPGRQARHNVNYWQFGDYLGIGAGAHGKITLPSSQEQSQQILRTRKTRMPAHYLSANTLDPALQFTAEKKAVPQAELPLEFMMNALRLSEGVPLQSFTERTGLPLAAIEDALASLRRRGLLQPAAAKLQATETGLKFLNELLLAFV